MATHLMRSVCGGCC